MKSMARVITVVACGVVMTLASCGTPSNADARRAIEQKIDEEAEGRLELMSFNITERLPREHSYTIEYEGEIRFLTDARWALGDMLGLTGRRGFKTMEPLPPADQGFTGWDDWFARTQTPGTDHQAGGSVSIHGNLVFERTQSGWRLARVEVSD